MFEDNCGRLERSLLDTVELNVKRLVFKALLQGTGKSTAMVGFIFLTCKMKSRQKLKM